MAAKKNLYSVRNLQILNARDLRKVYAHARQIEWVIGDYGTKIKSHEDFTLAIQDEFKRRGMKLPY